MGDFHEAVKIHAAWQEFRRTCFKTLRKTKLGCAGLERFGNHCLLEAGKFLTGFINFGRTCNFSWLQKCSFQYKFIKIGKAWKPFFEDCCKNADWAGKVQKGWEIKISWSYQMPYWINKIWKTMFEAVLTNPDWAGKVQKGWEIKFSWSWHLSKLTS